MNRYVTGATIPILCVAMSTGCTAQQPLQERASIRSFDLQLKNPSTAEALLYNMRAVLERGDLKRRDFFTQELLTATFGGSTLKCNQNTQREVFCSLRYLDYLHVRSRRRQTIEFIWSDVRSSVPGNPYFASFGIGCNCDLTNTDIEAVFGNVDRTVERDRRFENSHYPLPPRATHPLGNKVARYTLHGPEGYVTSFEVRYDYEGYVTSLSGSLDSHAYVEAKKSRQVDVGSP